MNRTSNIALLFAAAAAIAANANATVTQAAPAPEFTPTSGETTNFCYCSPKIRICPPTCPPPAPPKITKVING